MESDWRAPSDEAGPERRVLPGAMGPPLAGPPPRLSAQTQTQPQRLRPPTFAQPQPQPFRPPPFPLTPAARAWQGAVKPPAFVAPVPGRLPERPTYRESSPVRSGRVWAGLGIGSLWMLLFGIQAGSLRVYAWVTIVAALIALVVAAVLARFGDRGVAVGVAVSTGLGLTLAGIFGAVQAFDGHWILW